MLTSACLHDKTFELAIRRYQVRGKMPFDPNIII